VFYKKNYIKVTTNPTTKDTINNQKLSNNKISTTRPYLAKISIDMLRAPSKLQEKRRKLLEMVKNDKIDELTEDERISRAADIQQRYLFSQKNITEVFNISRGSLRWLVYIFLLICVEPNSYQISQQATRTAQASVHR
jgi:hypothetical protein